MSAPFACFKCQDENTPLYCLNCANEELKAQLAAFHAAMERERKPDWEEWLKVLAGQVEHWSEHLIGGAGRKDLVEAARQLRSMADSFTHKANFVPAELKIKKLEERLVQEKTIWSRNVERINQLESALAASEQSRLEMRRLLTLLRPQVAIWLVGTGELAEIDKALSDNPPTGYVKVEQLQSHLEQALSCLCDAGNNSRHDPSWIRPMTLTRQQLNESCQQAYHHIHKALESLKEGKA